MRLSDIKMPDLSNMELPDMGDGTSSILIFIGVAIIAFLIFRKFIKMAIFVGIVILLVEYLA